VGTNDDLVNHLSLGPHRQTHQIELGADHGLDHLAVGGVVRGLEHILGINRRRHVSRQRPLQRAAQRHQVSTVDQDRLADQRQIFRARAVAIGLADAFRKRCRDASSQKRSHVELLPCFKVGSDHDRDLGIELHERSEKPASFPSAKMRRPGMTEIGP
jgi:hypothetical protein